MCVCVGVSVYVCVRVCVCACPRVSAKNFADSAHGKSFDTGLKSDVR